MNLLALLDKEHIKIHHQLSSKKALFESIAQHIVCLHPALSEEDIIQHLMNRERLGSTSLGHGVAVPHCRLVKNHQSIVSLTLLSTPVVYEQSGNSPEDTINADIIFTILVPDETTNEHLELLAEIASLVQSDVIRNALRHCQTKGDVLSLLSQPVYEEGYQWMSQ